MNPHHVQGDASAPEPALPWWIRWCRWLWKLFAFVGTSVLLALAVNVASTWFTTSQGNIPADSPFGVLLTHWPIVLPIGCCLLFAAVLIWMVSRWRTPAFHTPSLSQQNRARMLDRLRQTYADLMRQSLQGAVWMDLALSEKADAVRNAATLLFRSGKQPERPLPANTRILDAYDQAARDLLILGAPGTGKSTLLLDLAQRLVERAAQDAGHPLPVILPLSSWAVKRPALENWIVEQLTQIYDIPHLVGERWIREHEILPLLDGLDEMDEAARPACIANINAYHQAHLGVPLVVCSRLADYEAAAERQKLVLQSAVVVQQLTHEQVDIYLQNVGPLVATLHGAITKNAALQELATTPLMLNVLILTYQETSVQALPKKETLLQHVWTDYIARMVQHKGEGTSMQALPKKETLLQHMWTDYVARMVQRKGDVARYPLKQTRDWLSWLARQMRAHQRSIFYEEYLWTDWLTSSQQRRAVIWLSLRLPALVLGSIIFLFTFVFTTLIPNFDPVFLLQIVLPGGFVGLCLSRERNAGTAGSGLQTPLSKRALLMRSIVLGLLVAATPGLYLGSTYFLGDWIRDGGILGPGIALSAWVFQILVLRLPRQQAAVAPHYPSSRGRISAWFNSIAPRSIWQAAIALGAGLGLSYGLKDGLSADLSTGLGTGLSYGLIFGISVVLLSTLLGALSETFRFAEQIHWTWQGLRRPGHLSTSLIVGGILFLLIGLSRGLSTGLSAGLLFGLLFGLSSGLSAGLSSGLSYWVLLGIYQGIQQEQVKDQDRHQFNQGIRRSLRNGILIGLVGAMTITGMGLLNVILSAGLSEGLSTGLSDGLTYGLGIGLSSGLSSGLTYGLSIGLSTWWLLAISGFLLMWATSGGLTILRHYVIRLLLARSRTFPWCAQAFLDDATARILLQRVGGGYRFMHRLLLDYFADLDQSRASADPIFVSSTTLTPPH